MTPFGEAWLCSFPFWIVVDTTDSFDVREITLHERLHRFYPLFRSGPANFQPMPYIAEDAIPFQQDPHPRLVEPLKRMASIPKLGIDAAGQTAFTVALGPLWTDAPTPFPMDSLRIDIEGTHEAVPEYPNAVATSLMEQIRWRTRQWWITRSTAGLQGYVRNSFAVDQTGLPQGDPDGLCAGQTVTGFELPLSNEMWHESIDALAAQNQPPEYDILALDAHYFLSIGDFRRAVIDAVTACEHARDRTFERLYSARVGSQYKRGRVIKSESLPDTVDKDLLRLNRRSYAAEHADMFAVVRDLWDSRGRVAHGGPATLRTNGALVPLNADSTSRLVKGARHLIEWLTALA